MALPQEDLRQATDDWSCLESWTPPLGMASSWPGFPKQCPPRMPGKKHQKRKESSWGVISYIIWGFISDILHSYGKAILYGSIFWYTSSYTYSYSSSPNDAKPIVVSLNESDGRCWNVVAGFGAPQLRSLDACCKEGHLDKTAIMVILIILKFESPSISSWYLLDYIVYIIHSHPLTIINIHKHWLIIDITSCYGTCFQEVEITTHCLSRSIGKLFRDHVRHQTSQVKDR